MDVLAASFLAEGQVLVGQHGVETDAAAVFLGGACEGFSGQGGGEGFLGVLLRGVGKLYFILLLSIPDNTLYLLVRKPQLPDQLVSLRHAEDPQEGKQGMDTVFSRPSPTRALQYISYQHFELLLGVVLED